MKEALCFFLSTHIPAHQMYMYTYMREHCRYRGYICWRCQRLGVWDPEVLTGFARHRRPKTSGRRTIAAKWRTRKARRSSLCQEGRHACDGLQELCHHTDEALKPLQSPLEWQAPIRAEIRILQTRSLTCQVHESAAYSGYVVVTLVMATTGG